MAQWSKFTILIFSMIKMFNYLDRYYLNNSGSQNLTETALSIFRQKVFDQNINDLRRSLLQEIEKDRENDFVEHPLIKEGVKQFIYMGFQKKIIIRKIDSSLHWMGDKNLKLYED